MCPRFFSSFFLSFFADVWLLMELWWTRWFHLELAGCILVEYQPFPGVEWDQVSSAKLIFRVSRVCWKGGQFSGAVMPRVSGMLELTDLTGMVLELTDLTGMGRFHPPTADPFEVWITGTTCAGNVEHGTQWGSCVLSRMLEWSDSTVMDKCGSTWGNGILELPVLGSVDQGTVAGTSLWERLWDWHWQTGLSLSHEESAEFVEES